MNSVTVCKFSLHSNIYTDTFFVVWRSTYINTDVFISSISVSTVRHCISHVHVQALAVKLITLLAVVSRKLNKKNIIFREEATPALASFHAVFLFCSNWKLEKLVFVGEESRSTRRKTLGVRREPSTNSTAITTAPSLLPKIFNFSWNKFLLCLLPDTVSRIIFTVCDATKSLPRHPSHWKN